MAFRLLLLSGMTGVAMSSWPAAAQDAGKGGDDDGGDIIVTTRRQAPGAAVGNILPDQSFSPATIRSFGASNVAELVDSLAPQVRSSRNAGGPPIVLVNGWRVSSFVEIRDLPPEAIQRVDILPEDAALKYGFGSDQKVINIVLRGRFKGLVAELSDSPQLSGEPSEISGQVGLTSIEQRNKRLNVNASYRIANPLYQAGAANTPRLVLDGLGNVLPAAGSMDGQVDLGLSAAAGAPVLLAGVPAAAANGPPTLADFVATANQPRSIDQSSFHTLVGRTTELAFSAAYAQPVSKSVSATLNGRIDTTSTRNSLGLSELSLILPTGNPFSPFSRDVVVDRPLTALGARQQRINSTALHLGSTFQGYWPNWRWTAAANYDRIDTRTTTDRRTVADGLQTRLDNNDPTFNPFATLDPSVVRFAQPDRATTLTNTGGVDLLINGTVRGLPIGNAFVATRLGVQFSGYRGRSARDTGFNTSRVDRSSASAQVSIDLPLFKNSGGRVAFPGSLSINGNARLDRLSDMGSLASVGAGLYWSPADAFRATVSVTHGRDAPDLVSLGGVAIVTPGVRTYDFTAGRAATVTSTSAGNSGLGPDRRDVFQIGATLLPVTKSNLTLTAGYTATTTHAAAMTFLAATPAIEAAYPQNFVRDARGYLTEIYFRPVTVARTEASEFRWGVNWSTALKSHLQDELRKMRAAGINPLAGTSAIGLFGGGSLVTSLAGAGFGSSRLQLSLYHTIRLANDAILADGHHVDLLRGGAIDQVGGRSRHQITGQVGYTRNGVGARASVDWLGPAKVFAGPGMPDGVSFRPITQVNLRLFADLSPNIGLIKKVPLLFGTRISLAINNLLDTRRRLGGTSVPNSLQSALFDPTGRTIRLSIRKLFF